MERVRRHESFEKAWKAAQDAARMAHVSLAQQTLNPERKHLTMEARKRLGWIYELERSDKPNTTKTARKVGISREWLTKLHRKFVTSGRDPHLWSQPLGHPSTRKRGSVSPNRRSASSCPYARATQPGERRRSSGSSSGIMVYTSGVQRSAGTSRSTILNTQSFLHEIRRVLVGNGAPPCGRGLLKALRTPLLDPSLPRI